MPINFSFNNLRYFVKAFSQKNKRNQLILSVIVIFLTSVILGILIIREREVLLSYQWNLRLLPAILSFVLFSIALLLAGLLWGWINRKLGSNISYFTHIQYYISSNLTKRIPGTVWYVAQRAQLYNADGIDRKFTSIASGVELTLIIISGIIISLLFAIQILIDYKIGLWLFIGVFIIGMLIIHPTVLEFIFKALKTNAPKLDYRNILLWLLSYGLLWILGGVVLFCIGNAITNIPIEYIGYIIGSWAVVGILSSLLFFSPSNFGITEIGLSVLLASFMPLSIGIIIAIASRILIIVYEIIWALAVVWYQSLSEKN
jgi:hypothetical protein